MNVQRLIEKYKKLEGVWDAPGLELVRKIFIEDLKQLDERQPVKVPQFVADWIESYKREIDIRDAMSKAYVSVEVDNWLMEVDADGAFVNQDLFAHAWLDGYEVEEEKRYIVKIKNLDSDVRVLKKRNRWYFGGDWGDSRDTELKIHTRKELEEANFGWVFDCPGIEVEEVEG